MPETVKIKLSEYARLKERSDWLSCLETAGVDNWEGYDYACDIKNYGEKETEE